MMEALSARAAVLTQPLTTRVSNVEVPPPGPEEIRVRLQGCGICASNLPVWEGRPWFQYPLPAGSPGHEGWGIVDAVGSEVAQIQCGERVALLSYNAFAEYDVADAAAVVRIPASLEIGRASCRERV